MCELCFCVSGSGSTSTHLAGLPERPGAGVWMGSSPAGFSHLAGRGENGAREIGVKRATVRTQNRTERHSDKSASVGVAMVNGVTTGSFCLLVLITLNVGPLLPPTGCTVSCFNSDSSLLLVHTHSLTHYHSLLTIHYS